MAGETALDTSIAIRYLNGDQAVGAKVRALPTVVLPLTVVGELLFGAENSGRPLQNLARYLRFIDACVVVPMGRETAVSYSRTRLALKRKVLGENIDMRNPEYPILDVNRAYSSLTVTAT